MSAATESRPILVIDDDSSVGRSLKRVLETTGARVELLTGPFGVLNAVATHRPAIVIVDVMMPGLDGPAVVALIRGDAELSKTPVLLYSAIDEGELARRAEECGANGYMSKSLRPRELLAYLRPWLES